MRTCSKPCAEKSADVMLTTDDSLIKKVKENRDKIKVRVMNPVKFVEEVFEWMRLRLSIRTVSSSL